MASALSSAGCTGTSLFSGVDYPDRSRPIAKIETLGGVEYGATTEAGILFLGRSATEGPCRVHYFLGDQLMVEDGYVEPTGGVFFRAVIDLHHQHVPLLTRDLTPQDSLVAIRLSGDSTSEYSMTPVREEALSGNVLEHPGTDMAPGTPIFRRDEDTEQLQFAGLVAAEATIDHAGSSKRYLVYAGVDRIREMLLHPAPHPVRTRTKFRPDGIRARVPTRPTADPIQR